MEKIPCAEFSPVTTGKVRENDSFKNPEQDSETSVLPLILWLQEVAVRRTGTSHCYSGFHVFLILYSADGL